jgi:hypothetical protein
MFLSIWNQYLTHKSFYNPLSLLDATYLPTTWGRLNSLTKFQKFKEINN